MVKSKRCEELVKRIKKERGYILDWQELMAEYDPDFFERYDELYMGVMKGEHLPEKYKQLILCAAAACMLNEKSLEVHTKKALETGATPEQLIETLEIAFFLGGVPAIYYAAKYVRAAIDSMEAQR